jgi:hypothetical protein
VGIIGVAKLCSRREKKEREIPLAILCREIEFF